MSLLPWAELMASAAQMGLPPEAFWRTSLREWRLLRAAQQEKAMERGELEALLRLYPDDRRDT